MKSLKLFLVLSVVILMIAFTSCGLFEVKSPAGPSDPNDNGNDNGDDNGDNGCDSTPPVGEIGDTIRSCHFEITLHQAKYIDVEYRGPRVWVDATIKLEQAIVGNGAHIFTDCFTVQSSDGRTYSWGGLGDNDQLKQVTLFEGQEISGTTTIQVDKNASGFTAIFRESRMAGSGNYEDVLKWKLGF